jgi:hypothetical protein
MRRQLALVSAGVLLTAAAFAVSPALTAGAATQPVPKATGSVAIDNHAYMSFNAFDYGETGDRGMVDYTDFAMATADTVGSGVWTLTGTHEIVFTGGDHHSITIDSVTPLSTHSIAFRAHGYTMTPAHYTWTMTGTVSGTTVKFHMVYDQLVLGLPYYVDSTNGAIVGGVVGGTALDSMGDTLPWTMAAGAVEVLHYTTSVRDVVVDSETAVADFVYTIPVVPFVGTVVAVHVTDTGSPAATFDSMTLMGSPVGLTSGNLVVH